jgi:hypothetical protein
MAAATLVMEGVLRTCRQQSDPAELSAMQAASSGIPPRVFFASSLMWPCRATHRWVDPVL